MRLHQPKTFDIDVHDEKTAIVEPEPYLPRGFINIDPGPRAKRSRVLYRIGS